MLCGSVIDAGTLGQLKKHRELAELRRELGSLYTSAMQLRLAFAAVLGAMCAAFLSGAVAARGFKPWNWVLSAGAFAFFWAMLAFVSQAARVVREYRELLCLEEADG